MKPESFFKIFFMSLIFTVFLTKQKVIPTPINNQYDPVVVHTIFGTDKFYSKKNKFNMSLHLSPFYQHSSGARDSKGKKVPEGDMLGRWNMFGLFYGQKVVTVVPVSCLAASPSDKQFLLNQQNVYRGDVHDALVEVQDYIPTAETQGRDRYFNLSEAWRVLDNASEVQDPTADPTVYNYFDLDYIFTKEDDFDLDIWDGWLPLTYVDYEKMGLRGQLNFDFGFGFGVNVKGGIVDYEQKPTFKQGTSIADASTPWSHTINSIYEYLTKPEVIEAIANEVGLDVRGYHKTELEDTHFEIYWNLPFKLKDDEGDLIATVIPYLSVGMWIPTGKKKDINKAFSLPTGNDDFWGVTFEGSINIDFPSTIQIGFGGGAAFYESKNIKSYRVPSSIYQAGIYPWKASIKKSPGAVWYVNASFKAEKFIEDFSFFFDYIHTEHIKDSIKMQETDSTRNQYFKPERLEEDSKWRANVIHSGLNYHVSPGLEMGISFQAPMSGARIYKTTTILGTISFNF